MQGSCWKALAGAAAIVFSLSGAAQQTQPAIKGAGASFPALIYQQWAAAYTRESGVALTYTATGSGDASSRRGPAAWILAPPTRRWMPTHWPKRN